MSTSDKEENEVAPLHNEATPLYNEATPLLPVANTLP